MINEWLEISCTVIGFLVFLGVVVACLSILMSYAAEKIAKAVWRYKCKHHFNKKPIAKCYCVDCVRYDERLGYCHLFSSNQVADNAFCVFAEPKREDDCK